MEKQKFNEPEMNVTHVNEADIIRTSAENAIPLPDDWFE